MNDRLTICYVETDPKSPEKRMLQSARMFGIYPTCIGKGEPWNGFTTKMELYTQFLKTVKTPFVLGVDSRDVLFFDTAENILREFLNVYHSKGHQMLFNSETNCYPNKDLANKHPAPEWIKYRYLNAGCFIGVTSFVLEAFEAALQIANSDRMAVKGDDQEAFQHLFLDRGEHFISLDYQCRIFQVLWDEHGGRSANFDLIYGDGYIYNQNTDSEPKIFHYPGPTGNGNQVWKTLYPPTTSNSENFFSFDF